MEMRRLFIALGLIYLIMMSAVTPCFGECQGDLDGNGVIDGVDLANFSENYGSTDCQPRTIKYITCDGTLSLEGRWCDNHDGTVTDMATGLVWLQNANCLGSMNWNNAMTRPILELRDGVCSLTDNSEWGDWRLPTVSEIEGITKGPEAVSSYRPGMFTSLQSEYYWSVTTDPWSTGQAWDLNIRYGFISMHSKGSSNYILPVRVETPSSIR